MSRLKKQAAYQKGLDAESVAAQYLQRKGFEILEQRYKTPGGEIDLIVQKGEMIVFVEVKAHKSEEQALLAVTEKARRRIETAALHYIAMHEEVAQSAMRFDVIVVPTTAPHLFGGFSLRHLDNAWMAGQ